MSAKFNAYIDGFNLYYGSLAGCPELKWLDLKKLAQGLFEGAELDKVYYFTSKSKGDFPNDQGPNRQERYWRALRSHGVEVVTGYFNSYNQHMTIATEDLKLFTIPRFRNYLGIVGKAFGDLSKSGKPKALVTRRTEKASDVNLAAQLPDEVIGANGKVIARPDTWR